MAERYAEWIKANVKGDGYGKCAAVTAAMAQEFPELRRRVGFFHSIAWGKRQHWWLLTEDGRIVDPTATQFPDGFTFPKKDVQYEDLTDCDAEELADKVPSGKCPNCGEPCYHGDQFCSDRCGDSYAAYVMGGPL